MAYQIQYKERQGNFQFKIYCLSTTNSVKTPSLERSPIPVDCKKVFTANSDQAITVPALLL